MATDARAPPLAAEPPLKRSSCRSPEASSGQPFADLKQESIQAGGGRRPRRSLSPARDAMGGNRPGRYGRPQDRNDAIPPWSRPPANSMHADRTWNTAAGGRHQAPPPPGAGGSAYDAHHQRLPPRQQRGGPMQFQQSSSQYQDRSSNYRTWPAPPPQAAQDHRPYEGGGGLMSYDRAPYSRRPARGDTAPYGNLSASAYAAQAPLKVMQTAYGPYGRSMGGEYGGTRVGPYSGYRGRLEDVKFQGGNIVVTGRPNDPPMMSSSSDQAFREGRAEAPRPWSRGLLGGLVALGDTTEGLSQEMLEAASEILQATMGVCRRSADLAESIRSVEQEYQPEGRRLGQSTGSKPLDQVLATIAEAFCECVSHLAAKASVYATLVAVLASTLTKLPGEVTEMDLVTAEAVKAEELPSDTKAAQIESCKLKRALMGELIACIITHVGTKFSECLTGGRVVEARNILRFLMESVSAGTVHAPSAFSLLNELLVKAELLLEGVSAEESEDNASELTIRTATANVMKHVVMSALPWLSAEVCESNEEAFRLIYEKLRVKKTHGARLLEACSPIHDEALVVDGLLFAWQGLASLRDLSGWKPKAIQHIHKFGTLGEMCTRHDGSTVSVELPYATMIGGDDFGFRVAKALEYNTDSAFKFSLEAGNAPIFQLAAGVSGSGSREIESAAQRVGSLSYDRAAADLGVGGSSLGYNGVWQIMPYVRIFSDSELAAFLPGTKLFEVHDRWLVDEILRSIIHSFRHAPSLCAEFLLRLPIVHEQFIVSLVETVFTAALQIPRSAEPLIFYARLLDILAKRDTATVRFIDGAFLCLSRRSHKWDNQTTETLGELFGLWLSLLQGGPATSSLLNGWSPEVVTKETRFWPPEEKLPVVGASAAAAPVISLLDRTSVVREQKLPESLKLFLSRAMERLARLLWTGSFLFKLPEYLQPYVPVRCEYDCPYARAYQSSHKTAEASASDGAAEAEEGEPEDCPIEYVFFRRVIRSRFDSDEQLNLSLKSLAEVIFLKFLGHPRLVKLPSINFLDYVANPRPAAGAPAAPQPGSGASQGVKAEGPSEAAAPSLEEQTGEKVAEGAAAAQVESSAAQPAVQDFIKCEEPPVDVEAADVSAEDADFKVKCEDITMGGEDGGSVSVSPLISEDLHYHHDDKNLGGWGLIELVDLFIRSLLGHGCKSLTHACRALENYRKLLCWLKPSNPQRSDIQIDKSVAERLLPSAKSLSEADTEYCAAILRSVFSYWRESSVECEFLVTKIVQLGILSAEEAQTFILARLSVKRLGDLSTTRILFGTAELALKAAVQAAENLKLLRRALKGVEGGEEAAEQQEKLAEGERAVSVQWNQVAQLTVNAVALLCSRIAQLSSSQRGEDGEGEHAGAVDIDPQEEDGSVAAEDGTTADIEILTPMVTKHQKFLEKQLLKRLLHYGRTYLPFLNTYRALQQVQVTGCEAQSLEILNLLADLQKESCWRPSGVVLTADLLTKKKKKDEENLKAEDWPTDFEPVDVQE